MRTGILSTDWKKFYLAEAARARDIARDADGGLREGLLEIALRYDELAADVPATGGGDAGGEN